MIPEEDVIAYAKAVLKPQGFKKKNKRWTKNDGTFTLIFFIQGSQWSKEDYYIRPGVLINDVPATIHDYYGHFHTQIKANSLMEIFQTLQVFFDEWTNKRLIRERILAFMEWETRNPLEKRRAGLVDYDSDPVPARLLFGTQPYVFQYVIEHF